MSEQQYEFHPYASILPMLGQTELNELAADIQANGLREDVVLLDGKILDGRNRYKACGIARVEPRFREFNGDGDPIDYIVSVNFRRRHLTGSQKALAMGKIANLPRGNPDLKTAKTPTKAKSTQSVELGKTVAQVAKEIGVGTTTLTQAKQVLREAPAETVKQIERGEKSVATAVKEIKQEKAKQEEKAEKHYDKTGYLIPDAILADWQHADSFRADLNQLQQLKLKVEKETDKDELRFREIGQDTVADLKNAWTTLKQVLPYAVCPACQGRTRSKCSACKRRGFVSEFGYKHWFAKEVIELRERAIKK